MKLKKFIPLIPATLILASLIFPSGCANTTQPPSGGDKDTIPPRLTKVTPFPGTTGSMASFVWIVLSLMITVRQVFNNVWKVDKERNFLKMIGIIIGITILSPFVVIILFSGSVVYSHVLNLVFPSKLEFFDGLKSLLSWLSFAGISVLIMSAMYKYIPGTKVHYRHALKAAIISGIAFAGVQYLYLETQVMVAKQSAVYGVLAAVPLFMIWLNLGWTIILYGAELSFAFQNVDSHRMSIETLNQLNEEAVRTRKQRFQKNLSL